MMVKRMALHAQIQEARTSAMKARETLRLNTLRGLLTAFTNENVAKRRKPETALSDEDVLSVIAREAKKRRESIEQFEKGGRTDLAAQERAELAILEAYLPEQLGEVEIRKVVEVKKTALGISDVKQKGTLIKAVMEDLRGQADGRVVSTIVDELLKN